MPDATGTVEARDTDGILEISARGAWTVETADALDRAAADIGSDKSTRARIDATDMHSADSAGLLVLHRLQNRLRDAGLEVETTGLAEKHQALVSRIEGIKREPLPQPPKHHPVIAMVERVGRASVSGCNEAAALLNFLGLIVTTALGSLFNPRRIRMVSMINHIERTGLDALPIVGLLAFLIGVVVSFQGADQLSRFGAQIFTVNLLGISMFREMGVLLTAIVVAGRSGSAFAAQIGTMQVNQEVDAMRAIGLDPVEILVLPRVGAMIITLPLLAVFANIMGLFGGGLMIVLTLDISAAQFLERLQGAVTATTFWLGIIKAPVFGVLIALTGCREGMRVTGSAESVGLHTTRSVVISIFLVIVADAGFSILFSALGI